MQLARVLTVAGSDSGGGAGIQADLKTITALGGWGMSVITALTAQNTVTVAGIHEVPPEFVTLQFDTVVNDLGVDAVKTGMLSSAPIIRAVAASLRRHGLRPLVVDPVMVAKGGASLLAPEAVRTLVEELLPLATVITPNLAEAEALVGFSVRNVEEMKGAAARLRSLGPPVVVVKGGHLAGEAIDVVDTGEEVRCLAAARLATRDTHGTGCSFAAAIATLLAQGIAPLEAVARAKEFVFQAIRYSLRLGRGHGPANPWATMWLAEQRQACLAALSQAWRRLQETPCLRLLPEVRANMGYALPRAASPAEVAAFPGRLTAVDGRWTAVAPPAFGASRHIALVILAAMARFDELRAAMNVRWDPAVEAACQRLGWALASFDRRREPAEVKEREGSTLEWGTAAALEGWQTPPDAVWDAGEVGKEPMLRVLGRHPQEVVEKVIALAAALGADEDKKGGEIHASR